MTQKQLFDLPIGAGQYTEQSERGAQGRWYKMDKARFRRGLAEKIGGWTQLAPQFLGIARRLRDWSSLDAKRWSAIGTDTKLYVWQDGSLYDITPVRRTVTLTAPFTTENSPSLSVTVTDVNHGAQTGDYVRVSNAIVGGSSGILVDGEYQVISIVDTDNFIITVDTAATGPGAAGEGGTPTLKYDISAGAQSAVTATGYGTGPYGREGYGNARTGSTLVIGIRTWSLDTWGEDLLASPRGGAIYWWDRSKGTGSRAEVLGGDSPPYNQAMVVSQRDRHVIALGAFDYFNNAIDPMLIRWCSTEDLNDWIPTSTNTSGDLRLYSGSKIVTGVRSRLETVIFTDVSVHTLPFVGGYDVFGLNIVGENVSILGPNAAVPIDARVIFMAEADFYIYDGIVRVIPCDVRNFVYDNLNTLQRDKVYGGLNREFNEVWFFYPSYDVDGWVQDDFSLGIPPGYQLAQASLVTSGDTCWNGVTNLSKFEGTDGATAYTDISSLAVAATFQGGAQLDTAQSMWGSTASLLLSPTGGNDAVKYGLQYDPSSEVYAFASTDQVTIEAWVRFNSLPTNGTSMMVASQSNPDFRSFELEIYNDAGIYQVRGMIGRGLGLSVTAGDILVDPVVGTWYHVALQQRYVDASTRYLELLWNGDRLLQYNYGSGSNAPDTVDTSLVIGAYSPFSPSSSRILDGWIDEFRFSICTAPRYPDATTYAVPTATFPETGGGGSLPGDIGYTYGFNSTGFTAPTGTANNGYEYDYYLINPEPILTPLTAEYAVEFAFDSNSSGDTHPVGMVILREEITGTGETSADDARGIYIECDWFNDDIVVYKKDDLGVKSAMDNDPGAGDWTTVTGVQSEYDTKYILTVQVDTPTITVYLDGNLVFTFDLSAPELLLFTGGSFGLHAAPTPPYVNEARFYNLAAGPIGVITAADYDISPIEVNRYVIFNYEEGTWATGKMSRTAWADRSPLLEKPYGAGVDGYLYQHETGTDDNGAAMPSFIESFDMEIPQAGEELMHIDQLIPDFQVLEGSVDVYLTGRKYPQDPNRISKGPYTVQNGTRKLSTRMKARQVALRVESNAMGDKWRFGTWRGRAGPHGKRG